MRGGINHFRNTGRLTDVPEEHKNGHNRQRRLEGANQEQEKLAPQVGFEPTTLRLTAGCSAIELLRSVEARAEPALLERFNHNILRGG